MSRASNGIYTLPNTVNPVVPGTPILSTWANTTLDDVAQALTDSLDRGGKGSMTAPLKASIGTVALPSLTFSTETNSGLYRVSAGLVGFSVLGSSVMTWAATEIDFLTQVQFNTMVLGTDAIFSGNIATAPGVDPSDVVIKDQLDDAFAQSLTVPYTTVALTQGSVFGTAAGVTIPTGFAPGEIFGIYNNSAATIPITQGVGLTLRFVGSSLTGNRTLAQRGLAMFYPITTTEYVVSGGGLL